RGRRRLFVRDVRGDAFRHHGGVVALSLSAAATNIGAAMMPRPLPPWLQSGFLSEEDRKALTALARDGSSPCRVSRRANALVLLDKGWSCQQVADALLLDDDTIRGWRKLFEQRGVEGITGFDVGGSASYLGVKQEDDLKAWVGAALPRSTRQIGAWIEKEFGLVYESRSGLIALL